MQYRKKKKTRYNPNSKKVEYCSFQNVCHTNKNIFALDF